MTSECGDQPTDPRKVRIRGDLIALLTTETGLGLEPLFYRSDRNILEIILRVLFDAFGCGFKRRWWAGWRGYVRTVTGLVAFGDGARGIVKRLKVKVSSSERVADVMALLPGTGDGYYSSQTKLDKVLALVKALPD